MSREATRRQPRWRPPPAPPQPVLQLRGRHLRRYTRQLAAATAAQPAAQPAAVVPQITPFRHRYQLLPVWWALSVVAFGLGCHLTGQVKVAVFAGVAGGAAIAVFAMGHSSYARKAGAVTGALTALWLPLLAAFGPKPSLWMFAACWAAVEFCQVRYYRARPVPPPPPPGAIELWAESLGAKGRLAGSWLTAAGGIDGGGSRYTVHLKRGEQEASDVFSHARKIASLFGKPVTEVYPERFHDAREHQVRLTLLRENTLQTVRMWNGEGIDPATGLAVIGDYPDGSPAHFRFWSPRNGAEQSVYVGVKGSGKSYGLHCLLSCAVSSQVPVVPIVMDPQQGQSLPDWRGYVPYARGVEECFAYLRGFEAGMEARSYYLAELKWTDDDGYERPGMDFYDPHKSGLPLIFGVLDEAHLCLTDPIAGSEAVRIVGNLVKLNRKAGGHMVLCSHTLMLSQLGDMTLRAMLVGGNVIALRTGETLSGGVVGLEADPRLLPRRFPNGTETHGLGYIVGPDERPDSPFRMRLVRNPRKVAAETPIAEMDEVFGSAFRAVIEGRQTALPVTAPAASPVLAAVDDGPAPGGRTAADAILAVLTRPMERGEILMAVKAKATEWGRAEPWSMRAVTGPLKTMTEDGRVVRTPKPGKPDDGIYSPPSRPALSVVGGNPRTGTGEA